MKLGRVIESEPENAPSSESEFVTVQPLNALLEPVGDVFFAVNAAGARTRDRVLVAERGRGSSHRSALPHPVVVEIVSNTEVMAREEIQDENRI